MSRAIEGLPFLLGCITHFPPRPGLGVCFQRSAALVLDLGGRGELVIGTLAKASEQELAGQPFGATQDFIHCWVEANGWVLAPTLVEEQGDLYRIDRETYLNTNSARDMKRLTYAKVRAAFRGRELEAHFKHGKPLKKPGKPFAIVLCRAAGVEIDVDPDGGLIPAS